MFTRTNFTSRDELVGFVKSHLNEARLYAKQHSLPNAKVETVVEYVVSNGIVTITPIDDNAQNEVQPVAPPANAQPDNTDDIGNTDDVGDTGKTDNNDNDASVVSEEQLAKVVKHYEGKVKALTAMIDTVRGTINKLAVLDGMTLQTTVALLHPSEVSAFQLDFSTAKDLQERLAILNAIDTKALALSSYDGTFKLDGIEVTKELVQSALAAKVTPFDKMETAIANLKVSEEYVNAFKNYQYALDELRVMVEKIGAEVAHVYEVKNPIAKGGKRATSSTSTSEANKRQPASNMVVVAGLNVTRKAKKGSMTLTTDKGNVWKLVVSNTESGETKVYDNNGDCSLSKATVLAYKSLTSQDSNISAVKCWVGDGKLYE